MTQAMKAECAAHAPNDRLDAMLHGIRQDVLVAVGIFRAVTRANSTSVTDRHIGASA